ncbi:hypothetical protein AB0L53_19260 [Nonomuraea sp. NPDC052129]|uniref:BTAD domain-containing putative transcriptional regulator n=1 Tax=Nonomuraea sp. NPDC052129 TaxID=3154651 RepID=UPI00343437CF
MGSVGTAESADRTDRSPREWCEEAVTRLQAGRPEAALEAARTAADMDPANEWAYRLISLALERQGRDADAVAPAEHAVRLALGSWPARLRLGTALRRVPGHWDEAVEQAALARAYAPEEAAPHVLRGDQALLRAEHAPARRAYLTALDRDPAHPQARVNLGLTLLRWDRLPAHRDPAWPIDPRESGRARRALEVWSRQSRLLVALATIAIVVAALGFDRGREGRLGGLLVLVLLVPITLRQVRRVGVWSYVPAMLGRDPWLGAALASAVASVAAFAGWLTMGALPDLPTAFDPVWAALAGVVVLGWPVTAGMRALAELWRGSPMRALAQFARVPAERTARRNTGVTLWIMLGRTWSVLVPLVCGALAVEPRAAVLAVAVPYPLLVSYRRVRHREDRWLPVATGLVVLASVACAAGGLLGLVWAWRTGLGALCAAVAVFALRAARAWWRGGPGPWRASLIMCDLPTGDAPSVALTPEVRQAFTYARSVVLSFGDSLGPRVVGTAATVTPSGELRLVAETQARAAVEADPRVAVFAADPLQRRYWVEVRGIAVADSDLLRVTPKQVLMGEFPGRHQRR